MNTNTKEKNNNPSVTTLSLEMQTQEYIKCAMDPVYFMVKYCFIQHPMKGKIKFDLYDFQQKSLAFIRENRFVGILKSRQLGISTLIAGYCLWLMLFHDDKNILVIAISQKTAKNIVLKVREMYKLIPDFLSVKTESFNLTSIRLTNGSQIQASAAGIDSARSEALSLLVMDEAAFIDSAEEIWISASQTLATGGQAVLLSTPNGPQGLFYDKYNDFVEGKKGSFSFIKLPWYLHPDRDQEWRDEQTLKLGKRGAAQECDCDFLTSGNSMIDAEDIRYQEDVNVMEPIEKKYFDNLHTFKYPEPGRKYIIPADVARGDGSDYSAFHVIDVESFEQVASFKMQLGTTEYADLLMEVGEDYNWAELIIENANIGWDVIQSCINNNYPNIFYTGANMGTEKDIYVSDDKKTPGFTTSLKTRPLMLNKLESIWRAKKDGIIIHDIRTTTEARVFVWKGGKLGAVNGKNDDLIMSLAIGCYVRETNLKLIEANNQMVSTMLNSIRRSDKGQVLTKEQQHANDRTIVNSRYIKGNKANGQYTQYDRMKNDPNTNWIL